MWQVEADTELILSALPATAVGKINHGEILLEYGNLLYIIGEINFNLLEMLE